MKSDMKFIDYIRNKLFTIRLEKESYLLITDKVVVWQQNSSESKAGTFTAVHNWVLGNVSVVFKQKSLLILRKKTCHVTWVLF